LATLQLGFKAFDPHELLCHFVAVEAGLYKRENLQIKLVDITFIPDTELPKQMFQASCGAALSSALKGIPQRIIFVATDKPMFWIYSSPDITSLALLKSHKIATFPVIAPPHHLANIILKDAGLNIEKDLTLFTARDDIARLGLLKSGNVDAAIISSAIAPPKIEGMNFSKLCFFGDEIRIPTTGLAVDISYLEQEPGMANAFVNVLRESLKLINQDTDLIGTVLQHYFDVDAEIRNETAELYKQYYTQEGQTTKEIAQDAINSLSNTMSISKQISWDQIYDFSFIK
jgi:ABC-type nitrate/sulfonate/bicarbonate transport system substrate-binding protein